MRCRTAQMCRKRFERNSFAFGFLLNNFFSEGLFKSEREAAEGEETYSEEMVLQLFAQHNPPARIRTNVVQKLITP